MKKLTLKHQKKLDKYFDGQLNFITTFFIKNLIHNNQEAKSYLENLKDISNKLKSANSVPSKTKDEFWQNITIRIDQEEKASFYLGARRESFGTEKAPRKSLFANPYLSGASVAIASFFLGIVFRTQYLDSNLKNIENTSSKQVATVQGAVEQNTQLANSSLVNFNEYQRSRQQVANVTYNESNNLRPTTRQVSTEVDIDWLKSDGRIKIIPSSEGSGGVIWIKKKIIPIKIKKLNENNPQGIQIIEEPVFEVTTK